MKNIVKLIGVLLLLSVSLSLVAHPLHQLRARLDSINTMSASFKQQIRDGQGQVLQDSVGTMAIARPGKYRWQTTTPMRQLIIADGENMWIFDVDLKQVVVTRLRKGMGGNPALFLSGYTKDIGRFFMVQQNGEQFQLTPKNRNADFKSIYMRFSGNRLLQMKMTDNLGQTSDLRLTNVRVNQRIPKSKFVIVVPIGTDVIRPKS